MAVGQRGSFTASHNYAALWNWSKWTLLKPPDFPSSNLDQLDAVSCTSATHCIVSGHFVSKSTFHSHALTMEWNGRSWAFKKVPEPAKATDEWLYGISCTSKSFCLAVGDYHIGSAQPTLALTWDGRAWKRHSSQTAKGSSGSALTDVSCLSPKSCQAVGNYLTASFAFASLGESWNGASLTIRPTPNTAPHQMSQLRGVSCLSPSSCIAAGTLSARWDGHSWHSSPFLEPSKFLTIAYDVSCRSAHDCTAAGDYAASATSTLTFFVRWNGAKWVQQAGKNP